MESIKQDLKGKISKYSKIIVGSALAVIVLFNSYGYNDSGVSLRLQQPMIGHTWIKEEGFYFKLPFVSRTRSYNQKGTIASSDNESIMETASLTSPPRALQFADSYEMDVEWSMRYEIPMDDDGLEKMHVSLKSEDNLLGNTLMPFAQTLVNDSVNQMLGGDFAQGGRNSLRTLIDNQSQNGMYQTKVKKVKTNRVDGTGSNKVTGGTSSDDLEITTVVYLTDTNGKKLRTPLAIEQYGIKIVPNSIAIIETKPLGRLVKYIDTKQANIALQIEQDEQQKLLAKQAKTSKLKGEKELIDRTNQLNIKKQEAIIAMERQVEEAKLQAEKEIVEKQKVADLAIIDKQRELQIAQSNEGIQKANSVAAKHEAVAIKEVGFAKAEVKKADYAAIDKAVLALEVDKAKALALYSSNIQVTMPTYVGGSNGEGSSSLEAMSSLKVMEMLGKPVTPLNK